MLAERHLATLHELGTATALARTEASFCQLGLASLAASNPYDVPWAILYKCSAAPSMRPTRDRRPSLSPHDPGRLQLELQGTIGVPAGHASVMPRLTIGSRADRSMSGRSMSGAASSSASLCSGMSSDTGGEGALVWPEMVEAITERRQVHIAAVGARCEGFELRGWPEATLSALVVPILAGDDEHVPQAVFVFGLNPRLPFGDSYRKFHSLLASQFATGLAAALSSERAMARNEAMLQLDRDKSAFFSSASHELRTPLSLIVGPLHDVLRDHATTLPASARELLTICSRNGDRLSALVNGLLDFARLEAGRAQAVFRPCALGPWLVDLCALFRSGVERKGIRFEVVVADIVPVYVDPGLLEKAVTNLLSNATKYTETGSIHVRYTRDSTNAVISVTDTGLGIPAVDVPRVFERFFRSSRHVMASEGTGIGLALAQSCIEALGGQIGVSSVLGQGTTFTIQLKLGKAHLDPSQIDETPAVRSALEPASRATSEDFNGTATNSTEPSSERTPPHTRDSTTELVMTSVPGAALFDLKASRILLADDNADMRRYIRTILPASYEVIEAHDGEEALQLAIDTLPDLILSDVMMPRLDGLELARSIRDDPIAAAIPIVLLSARAGPEARVDGLSTGADDYLTKPFNAAELVARVRTHLQLGKIRRELDGRVLERTAALAASERALRSALHQLELVSSVVPVGIWASAADGRVVHCNAAWRALTDLHESATLDDWLERIHPDDRTAFATAYEQVIRGGPASSLDFRWIEEQRYARIEFTFSPDSLEQAFVAIGSLADTSYAKKLERQAIETAEAKAAEAEQLRKLQELSIDVSSHELRNPLSGITGSSELLAESLGRVTAILRGARNEHTPSADLVPQLERELEGNIELTGTVLICSRQMRRIADDVLHFSKVSLGMFSIRLGPFSPLAMVNSTLRMVETEASQRRIRVAVLVDPSIAVLDADALLADEQRLSQVVLNFVGNALRFTSDRPSTQSPTIEVAIKASREPPALPPTALRLVVADPSLAPSDPVWLKVAVTDCGPGIAPDEQTKLCQKFSQLHPEIDSLSGFGLGLFVSRKIVELHHGLIDVLSAPGVGSTFSFALPLQRSLVPVPVEVRPARPLSTARTVSAPASITPQPVAVVGQGAMVLCVDDSSINLKVLSRQLTQRGYQVQTAINGLLALHALNVPPTDAEAEVETGAAPPSSFDAVLMDIEMPVMDGLTAIRRLRQIEARRGDEGRPRLPVIACTGNARQEQVDKCLQAGFDAVVVKPYQVDQLIAELSAAIQRHRGG